MIPDNVEKIVITKEDYDRNVEQLLLEKINAEQEIERLNNIINEKNKEIEDYSNKWCELAKAKTKSDNIINELEKYLNEQIQKSWEIEEQCYEDIENKLQELKGSDK